MSFPELNESVPEPDKVSTSKIDLVINSAFSLMISSPTVSLPFAVTVQSELTSMVLISVSTGSSPSKFLSSSLAESSPLISLVLSLLLFNSI